MTTMTKAATEFDQVFENLEAPDYPATCDNCGEVGTNASMERHECDDSGQCDACAAIVPRDELRTGMPAAGVEGTFCAKCRGEQPERAVGKHSPLPWRDNRTDTRYEILDAEGDPVLRINGGMMPTKPSAALILTAVNNHAHLVAALAGLMSRFEQTGEAWMSDPAWIAANEVLSRVRG